MLKKTNLSHIYPLRTETIIKYVRSKISTQVLAEYKAYEGTGLLRNFIYAGSDRIAMIDTSGNVYYYLKDHLGSNRVVVREDGVVMNKYPRYLAFDELESSTVSVDNAYTYTGKPLDDEHGLDLFYYGARYYDGEGRFTQIDPSAAKYVYLSPYVYAANNPLKYIDPDGRDIAKAIDYSAAFGASHTLLMVGNDNNGWQSISHEKTGGIVDIFRAIKGEVVPGMVLVSSDVYKSIDGNILTLQQIIDKKVEVANGYFINEALVVTSSQETDAIAIQFGRLLGNLPYHLYAQNCDGIATALARLAGIDFLQSSIIPRIAYSQNLERMSGYQRMINKQEQAKRDKARIGVGSFGNQNYQDSRTGIVTITYPSKIPIKDVQN